MGVGAQDDFDYTQNFRDTTGVETPDMVWDPGFSIWRSFGVTINSQMQLLSPDLTRGTDLFYGFGDSEQTTVLEALPDLST